MSTLWNWILRTSTVIGLLAGSATLLIERDRVASAIEPVFPIGAALVPVIGVTVIVAAFAVLAERFIRWVVEVSTREPEKDAFFNLRFTIESRRDSLRHLGQDSPYNMPFVGDGAEFTSAQAQIESLAITLNALGIWTPSVMVDRNLRNRALWVKYLTRLLVHSYDHRLQEAIKFGQRLKQNPEIVF